MRDVPPGRVGPVVARVLLPAHRVEATGTHEHEAEGTEAMTDPLPTKQRSTHEDWIRAMERVTLDDRARIRRKVQETAERIAPYASEATFGWSGGKDSQVLRLVAEAAGVTESYLAISDLEYPAFLAWATQNMPDGLTVFRREWDLDWLAAHPDMLFPDAKGAGQWFSGVQGWGRRRAIRNDRPRHVLLGRRRADGNQCGSKIGPAGLGLSYEQDGSVVWSPLADWTHEDVLAALVTFRLPLPPCYRWPRGFRVGTGSWPARQWVDDQLHGWTEVHTIDPSVVHHAATKIPSARALMNDSGCSLCTGRSR